MKFRFFGVRTRIAEAKKLSDYYKQSERSKLHRTRIMEHVLWVRFSESPQRGSKFIWQIHIR